MSHPATHPSGTMPSSFIQPYSVHISSTILARWHAAIISPYTSAVWRR